MNYEIFYDPVTHVIVNDFFEKSEYDELIFNIKQVEHNMTPGVVTHDTPEASSELNLNLKKNLNFWPYDNFDNVNSKKIIDIIETKMWSSEMRNMYISVKDSMFQFYDTVNKSSILVSKYNKGSFYGWHQDFIKSITANIFISEDDVLGGNLILKNRFDGIKEIFYNTNTCIFFPSECMHRVTSVENDVSRFSIQYFSWRMPK